MPKNKKRTNRGRKKSSVKPKQKTKRFSVKTKATKKTSSKRSKKGITKIKVVGVGGGGGNIVSRMRHQTQGRIRGVEYIAINTDAQDLNHISAHKKVYIGKALTKGLGAGMNPEIGKQAAEENRSEIGEMLDGADIVFVTGGFGGGTATGAAPIIAEIAREKGVLTLGFVTKPFSFEGSRKMSVAQEGIAQIKDNVDALVVVPNDRVFSVISKDTPVIKAFSYIDNVLKQGVQAIADLINAPGIINVDFADIKTILKEAGPSLIGVGLAAGQDRAMKAVDASINSPLLETSVDGAKGVLFGIAGGSDLKMTEINDIAKSIVANLDSNARVIFGAYHDRSLKKKSIKVTVVATGFNGLFNGGKDASRLFPSSKKKTFLADDKEKIPIAKNKSEEKEVKNDKENSGDSGKKGSSSSEKEGSSDPWDIPAFLRKKKK